jgi:DNA polymerase-3 subunit gamma/tau
MLTAEASNALLKTLEEPPSHVMFILATTNPEKLISTIRSRTTIINFRKATSEEIVTSLEKITKGEKLPYKKDALDVIAKSSDGSFRDATKILEQLVTEKVKPKTETVEDFVTNNTPITSQEILEITFKGGVKEVLTTIEGSVDKGGIAEEMLDGIVNSLHTEMLAKEGIGGEVVFDQVSQQRLVALLEYLMEAKKQVSSAAIEHLPIEIALLKWMEEDSTNGMDEEEEDVKKIEEMVKKEVKPSKDVEKPTKEDNKVKTNTKIKSKDFNNEVWLKILDQMRGVNYTIEALLRASKPMGFDGETLKLGVFYKFHKERLEEMKNITVLEGVVAKVMAKPTKIKCVLTEPEKVDATKEVVANVAEPKTVSSQDEDIMQVAKDIFGS